MRTELASVQTPFRERFGAAPTDYTVYVAADRQSAAAALERATGREFPENDCWARRGSVSAVDLSCTGSPSYELDEIHFSMTILALAPSGSLPPLPDGYWRGAYWLYRGGGTYTTAAYTVATGREQLPDVQLRQAARAAHLTDPLKSLDTRARFDEVGFSHARGVSYLAVQWLVERASEAALLDCYRLLPQSQSWEQAFENAFGIALDDFYLAFETYRRTTR